MFTKPVISCEYTWNFKNMRELKLEDHATSCTWFTIIVIFSCIPTECCRQYSYNYYQAYYSYKADNKLAFAYEIPFLVTWRILKCQWRVLLHFIFFCHDEEILILQLKVVYISAFESMATYFWQLISHDIFYYVVCISDLDQHGWFPL